MKNKKIILLLPIFILLLTINTLSLSIKDNIVGYYNFESLSFNNNINNDYFHNGSSYNIILESGYKGKGLSSINDDSNIIIKNNGSFEYYTVQNFSPIGFSFLLKANEIKNSSIIRFGYDTHINNPSYIDTTNKTYNHLILRDNGQVLLGMHVGCTYSNNGRCYYYYATNESVINETDKWYHIVIKTPIFDMNLDSGTRRQLIINGKPYFTDSSPTYGGIRYAFYGTPPGDYNIPPELRKPFNSDIIIFDNFSGFPSFNGTIDELILFNKVLTLNDALELYNNGSFYYDFNYGGNNSNLMDNGSYDGVFFGGLFNLQANSYFEFDLDDYFDNIDEFFILDVNGTERYEEESGYIDYETFSRKVDGKDLYENKETFRVIKKAGNVIRITAKEHNLIGVGLYGTKFGFPLYNNDSIRIGTIYKNVIIQIFAGLDRKELPNIMISEANRQNNIYDYVIDLTKYNDGYYLKDNLMIHDIKIFNAYKYPASIFNLFTPITIGSGITLNNFLCTDYFGINDGLCTYNNNHFTIVLNRVTGILSFKDKGTLQLYDSVNNKLLYHYFTYSPTYYVNDVEVNDDFLDIGFVSTNAELGTYYTPDGFVAPTPVSQFDWFTNLFPDKKDLNQSQMFSRIFFTIIFIIALGVIFTLKKPESSGYVVPVFSSIIVLVLIWFMYIGYIPIWVILLISLVGIGIGVGFVRKMLIGNSGGE